MILELFLSSFRWPASVNWTSMHDSGSSRKPLISWFLALSASRWIVTRLASLAMHINTLLHWFHFIPTTCRKSLSVAFKWSTFCNKNRHMQSCSLHFFLYGVFSLCPEFLEVWRPPATSMSSFLSTCHQPGRRRNGLSQDVSLGQRGRWSKSNRSHFHVRGNHGWIWVVHDGAISVEMRSWVMFDLILEDINRPFKIYSCSPQTSIVICFPDISRYANELMKYTSIEKPWVSFISF